MSSANTILRAMPLESVGYLFSQYVFMKSEPIFAPRCPTCDMLVDQKESHDQMPFCSARCRLLDLGRWLNEEHTLPCDPEEEEWSGQDEGSATSAPPKLPPGWHDP